jgi:hypothetical protein
MYGMSCERDRSRIDRAGVAQSSPVSHSSLATVLLSFALLTPLTKSFVTPFGELPFSQATGSSSKFHQGPAKHGIDVPWRST